MKDSHEEIPCLHYGMASGYQISDSDVKHSPLFDGKKAILCMAVLKYVEPEAMESLLIAMAKFGLDKVGFMAQEKTCVWESRNKLAHRFLNTTAEWMIFIDADMGIPCGEAEYFRRRFRNTLPDHVAGVNAIEKMLSWPKDKLVCGASYYDRQFGAQLQISKGCGTSAEVGFNERYAKGYYSGLHEVLWVATGGMRIHRSVFERIRKSVAKYPEIKPQKEDGIWGYFTPNRVGLGEDVAFCLRAREAGIPAWWDADLRFMHKGHRFL